MDSKLKASARTLLASVIAVAVLSGCGGDDSSSAPVGSNGPQSGLTLPGVKAGNTPPVISGAIPATAEVGKPFSFVPTATDADRDRLAFSVASKPSWMTFDAKTGRVLGTPTQADVGTHEDIVISVTDGTATASLPAASISVAAGSAAAARTNVTISWEPPTQNTDGTPLMSLSGYKVYYGKASNSYTKSVSISNPGLTRYVVENLEPGIYFFSITAISSNGVESAFSPEVNGRIG